MTPTSPRAVQIVCTIGPASRDPETLSRLLDAGMSVARINFAHGSPAQHRETVERLREVSTRRGRPLAILQDLAGPKVRLGQLEPERILLAAEQGVTLNCGATKGSASELPLPDPYFASEVRPGSPVWLGDGSVELEVLEVEGSEIHCRVVVGGEISSGKGVNAPGGLSARPLLDAKDRADLRLGAELGVDFVGVSYVRSADDLLLVRGLLAELGRDTPLVAKIETELALSNLDSVLAHCDAVMVARGDLSLEIPFERVPMAQKRIVQAAIGAGRPVITATQMLQSMVSAPRPTRAEVSDVASAVLDGSDALMLSDETAIGHDPVRTCRAMARIIDATQAAAPELPEPGSAGLEPALRELAVFARAAVRTARDVGARAILTWSRGGLAARLISRQRPHLPIVVPTRSVAGAQRLALLYGVRALPCPDGHLSRERLEAELGPLSDETALLMVGHMTGEARRIPWLALTRVIDSEDWGYDPRDGRPGGLP
jgi:pyruvate kinase